MATIPMGNFGQAIARPGPGPSAARVAPQGDVIGEALQRTTAQAGAAVADNAERDLRLQEESRRAQAALTLAKTNNALHDAHDEVARGVVDGSIPVDQASAKLQERVGKVRQDMLGGYIGPQRQALDASVTTTEGALQRNLQGVVVKRQQQDTASSIDDFGEQMSRSVARTGPAAAVASYSAYVRNTGPAAGLDQRAQDKLVQKFTEGAHLNFYQKAAEGALEQGNVEGLRALREQISGPAGEVMDPTKRTALRHTIFGWEQSLQARQDRAVNQAAEQDRLRYNAATEIYNKAQDITLGGGYLAPEFIKELSDASAGTELERDTVNLIASQRTVAGFASKPAGERAGVIERIRADRANPASGTTPMREKLLGAMVTMDEKLRTQAKENPWAAAQQAGVIQDAPVFNLADPNTAIATIQGRMRQIGAIENWTGTKVSPLQPAEIEQLGKFVRQLPIDQAATMLGSIGASLGDGDRVAALGKQLHDKDGTLGLAMMYATAGTTQGRRTAELVLRGEQVLKDKTAMVDKAADSGWKPAIAKQIRGAYSNREVEDQLIDASVKIAAANYADGGGTDLERAVRLATGGIIERNGQKVPLPYGMSEGDFNKRVSAITPQDVLPQLKLGPAVTDLQADPGSFDASAFGKRPDGTPKGTGYLGVLRRPDGGVSTELTIGVKMGGKDVDIPTLVPTLSRDQVNKVLALKDGERMPEDVVQKAVDFARGRMDAGKPVFAGPDDAKQQVFVGRTAMPLDQFVATLPKATLVHAGQGAYSVRAGTSLVTNAAGKPIVLQVKP